MCDCSRPFEHYSPEHPSTADTATGGDFGDAIGRTEKPWPEAAERFDYQCENFLELARVLGAGPAPHAPLSAAE